MTQYYKSDAGEYQAGTIIEIDDADYAAWLTRDSMGALQPYIEPVAAPIIAERQEEPQHDRMVRQGKKR
jgi:hypothetical protein